ncbi:MAG: PrsW family glutamic-type intramembrane protease [Oscillospiraceae bacterium]|nr:PrsW family glutamic-type intramembrane protease [Oscillospiraceae bacterium]
MTFLLLLAVLPAFVIMKYVYKMDKADKEPRNLLVKLFIMGALTTVSAVIFGTILGFFNIFDEGTTAYLIYDNFIATALVEEGGKYFVLKKKTWKNPEFNFTFDAVVYAVTVSLGFATLENILYVFQGGVGTAILRAVLSVPGHAIDGVFMGYYYGISKKKGKTGPAVLLIPVLMHGFYDYCLESESGLMILLFLVYEVFITIAAMKKIKTLSANDQYV